MADNPPQVPGIGTVVGPTDSDFPHPRISLAPVVAGLKGGRESLVAADVSSLEEYDQPGGYFAMRSIADPDGNVTELVGEQ